MGEPNTNGAAIAPTQTAAVVPQQQTSKMAEAYKMAKVFANSQLVPKHLQGKPDDCFIALVMADQLGENPLMVMQNIVIVQGTAGWKAQFVIARANRLGPFKDPIAFKTDGKGDAMQVTAYATIKATGTLVERTVTMAMAKAAGWAKNSKYQEMPEQMLSYRAACFLVRLYCPEVLLGMHTADELEDMRVTQAPTIVESAPNAVGRLNAALLGEPAPQPIDVSEPGANDEPDESP